MIPARISAKIEKLRARGVSVGLAAILPELGCGAFDEWPDYGDEVCHRCGGRAGCRRAHAALSRLLTSLVKTTGLLEALRVQVGRLLRCEGCGVTVDPVDAGGWQRTADDCELCPECWEAFVKEAEEEAPS
jgi:hypothetical protein